MAEFSGCYASNLLAATDYFDDSFLCLKWKYFCRHIAVADTMKLCPLIQQDSYDAAKVTMANYRKGPLVLNHLRLTLGDEVFFHCLKLLAAKYKGEWVNIHDFTDAINRVSGKDMTDDLKNLLWSAGYPSYRLAGVECAEQDKGYRTKVRIRNEGDYGLSCPLLLKMREGEKLEAFKVEGRDEREFVFITDNKVTDIVIDPELTAFQYHPRQKARLWVRLKPHPNGNWERYGKSYAYYLLGDYEKAIYTITEWFSHTMEQKGAKSIEALIEKSGYNTAYLFMRGVYYLALDDRAKAEQDIKLAFPYMLDGSLGIPSPPGRPPSVYSVAGVIPEDDLGQYLALLSQIAGRELFFEVGLDDEARKRQVEEWKQWWEKKGKHQKLDVTPLKERFCLPTLKGR